MISIFKDIYKYKYLLLTLVNRDVTKKYRRSFLGVLWSLLNPMMMMLITAMVFSKVLLLQI